MDKTILKDQASGNWRTQSLFLELGYTPHAVYTLKEDDYEYKGKTFPSIKKLYLELGDPTEYEFANTYLGGWEHWSRIFNNKLMTDRVEMWRQELELKLRCEGIKEALQQSRDGNWQAAKWVADRGWEKKAGRPSKADKKKQLEFENQADNVVNADFTRLGLDKE